MTRYVTRYVKESSMPYDATKMADWQISEAAEENMKTIWQLRDEMELQGDEVIPYGKMGRLNYAAIMARLDNQPMESISM